MNFGGHLMTGWAIASTRDFSYRERRFITVLAIAPDIDGLAMIVPNLFEEWHRTLGHNVFFGALVPLSAFLFFNRKVALRVLPWGYLALGSHYLLDLFITGWWAFYPLWPVSDFMILMSLYIPERIMIYHLQISLFLLLCLATFWIYLRTGRTPLEVLSPRLDRFALTFVTTPFKARCVECDSLAFYLCEECGNPLCGKHVAFQSRFRSVCAACKKD